MEIEATRGKGQASVTGRSQEEKKNKKKQPTEVPFMCSKTDDSQARREPEWVSRLALIRLQWAMMTVFKGHVNCGGSGFRSRRRFRGDGFKYKCNKKKIKKMFLLPLFSPDCKWQNSSVFCRRQAPPSTSPPLIFSVLVLRAVV